MSVMSSWLIIMFYSFIFLLILCLCFLADTEREVINPPTVIVNISIFLFCFVLSGFLYFKLYCLCPGIIYSFIIAKFPFWLLAIFLYILFLCLIWIFPLQPSYDYCFCDISFFYPFAFNLPMSLTLNLFFHMQLIAGSCFYPFCRFLC